MQLVVENITKEFGTPAGPLVVLKNVSLALSPGETLSVVGPSGAGKSTLLNIIGSLDKPTSGSVRLGDEEVADLSGARLAAFRSRQVGFVFQDHHLLPQCTALENVILPTLAADSSKEHGLPARGHDAPARANELLDRVGLAERMDSFPAQLSGGERQRVAIARAMVNDPPLLLCDEPTGNLDQTTGDRIGSLFAELAAERDVMVIVVTHNLDLARRFRRTVELREGMLHQQT